MSTNPHASPLAVALFEAFARNGGNSPADHFDCNAAEQWMQHALDECLPKPGAAQEAVAWFTDDHLSDKSATTYDASVAERWRAKGWPVTPLYAAPIAAAPVDQLETMARQMFEAQADKLAAPWNRQWEPTKENWRKKAAAALKASTPAAPGIDLTPLREFQQQLVIEVGISELNELEADSIGLKEAADRAALRSKILFDIAARLGVVIDASPEGGSDACIWTDDGEGNWATACGEIFTLIEGVPAENKVHHCPYCGKNLQATSAEVGA